MRGKSGYIAHAREAAQVVDVEASPLASVKHRKRPDNVLLGFSVPSHVKDEMTAAAGDLTLRELFLKVWDHYKSGM